MQYERFLFNIESVAISMHFLLMGKPHTSLSTGHDEDLNFRLFFGGRTSMLVSCSQGRSKHSKVGGGGHMHSVGTPTCKKGQLCNQIQITLCTNL